MINENIIVLILKCLNKDYKENFKNRPSNLKLE